MPSPKIFIALASRNYRLFFSGQVISLMGSWMTQTASMWLVYNLSSSPLLLGTVAFCNNAPTFFLAPFTGVLADRVNKLNLLMITQVASMLQSFVFATVVLTGFINVTWVIVLSMVQGIINSFDMPTRQSLTVEIVEKKEHLGSAIALNSSMFNLARLLGPSLAGFVIAWGGPGVCFLLDGVSYIPVLVALMLLKLPQHTKARSTQSLAVQLKEGIQYVAGYPPIRALILLVAGVSAIGYSYAVLTPVFARDIFGGDSKTLGTLMSSTGLGAISAAIYLGSRKNSRGLGTVITVGGSTLALAVLGYSLTTNLPVAMVCLYFAGLGGVLLMASANTLVQTLVDDDKRGRVMSLYAMAFSGTMPLGNLLMGFVANQMGPRLALQISALLTVTIIVIFYRRIPKLRAAVKVPLQPEEENQSC